MMKKVVYLLALIFACVFFACEDDGYSTNPQHLLSFSKDTLHLDTIFTGIGTSTRILKVYNRNKQALLISSVYLADAAKSGFRMNVDGSKGSRFTDVEIQGRDSLHIFVEATLEGRDQDLPFLIKDSIVFITNGTQQDIKLLAYGQDAVVFEGKVIDKDTTITSARPVLVYDSIHVAENTTLTLAEGTRLYFHSGAGMSVYGRINAGGNIAFPIVLRGDRTDNLFTDIPYDRLPGQWEGIRFHTTSYENNLNFVDIHGGEYGILCDSSAIDRKKLMLQNSKITQVAGDALALTNCQATVANTEISNAKGDCVNLLGGDYEFIHCTLANYYSWDARKGSTLAISNEVKKDEKTFTYPLINASFYNCIIAGMSVDEVNMNIATDEAIPFNYYFSHCLINSKEKESGNPNNSWLKDDNFVLIDKSILLYDFRLTDASAAIDIGLMEDATYYPVDRNGVARVSDKAPDAGCYEWVEE